MSIKHSVKKYIEENTNKLDLDSQLLSLRSITKTLINRMTDDQINELVTDEIFLDTCEHFKRSDIDELVKSFTMRNTKLQRILSAGRLTCGEESTFKEAGWQLILNTPDSSIFKTAVTPTKESQEVDTIALRFSLNWREHTTSITLFENNKMIHSVLNNGEPLISQLDKLMTVPTTELSKELLAQLVNNNKTSWGTIRERVIRLGNIIDE